jgi:lysophospholipase L1-like esterase
MEGANDLAEQLAQNGSSAPADAAISALRAMIDFAKTQNVRPFLATVTPENPLGSIPQRRGGAANFVPPFNDRLRSLAASEGITLVDVYAAITSTAGWETTLIGPDGLHPTVVGYAKIAETFFNALKTTLETTPSSVPTMRMFSAPPLPPGRTGSFARPPAAGPGSRPGARRPR